MITFALRILKLYSRDKTAVFFSLLSSMIIVGLYILFLGETYTSSLGNMQNSRQLMDEWIMAGLLATTSASTTIGSLSIMVNDYTSMVQKDFYCSPVSKRTLAGGYFLSTFFIGFILSCFTLCFAQVYICIGGGEIYSVQTYLHILLILLLVVGMNASMMFCISTFFKTNHAFSTATTLIGTLIGFLTGIYIPIGSLPQAIQWVIRLFPTSHGAVLLRQTMMKTTMSETFINVPHHFVNEFKEMLGVTFSLNDTILPMSFSYIYLLVFTFVFLSIGIYQFYKQRT